MDSIGGRGVKECMHVNKICIPLNDASVAAVSQCLCTSLHASGLS